jgi:hypothetical protein
MSTLQQAKVTGRGTFFVIWSNKRHLSITYNIDIQKSDYSSKLKLNPLCSG